MLSSVPACRPRRDFARADSTHCLAERIDLPLATLQRGAKRVAVAAARARQQSQKSGGALDAQHEAEEALLEALEEVCTVLSEAVERYCRADLQAVFGADTERTQQLAAVLAEVEGLGEETAVAGDPRVSAFRGACDALESALAGQRRALAIDLMRKKSNADAAENGAGAGHRSPRAPDAEHSPGCEGRGRPRLRIPSFWPAGDSSRSSSAGSGPICCKQGSAKKFAGRKGSSSPEQPAASAAGNNGYPAAASQGSPSEAAGQGAQLPGEATRPRTFGSYMSVDSEGTPMMRRTSTSSADSGNIVCDLGSYLSDKPSLPGFQTGGKDKAEDSEDEVEKAPSVPMFVVQPVQSLARSSIADGEETPKSPRSLRRSALNSPSPFGRLPSERTGGRGARLPSPGPGAANAKAKAPAISPSRPRLSLERQAQASPRANGVGRGKRMVSPAPAAAKAKANPRLAVNKASGAIVGSAPPTPSAQRPKASPYSALQSPPAAKASRSSTPQPQAPPAAAKGKNPWLAKLSPPGAGPAPKKTPKAAPTK
eukprot:TRINITY_DN24888_c0_g5_i1.p1 TRINITY_DN24888_c0_g5~~TRINITY_DN24888_c0_g5_i1.p1  ORF type:complete len:540 (-),score=139.25 TRINITY_DN24888_c0_g5_i1:374-1993(-)